jgi:NIMA-interacting peptidyl-prolyl cis-trans isomerase 1
MCSIYVHDDCVDLNSANEKDKITRSLDEARTIIQDHRDHIVSLPAEQQREEFAKIAAEMSDCSSARKGGDLGFFGPGQMQKAFEVSPLANVGSIC